MELRRWKAKRLFFFVLFAFALISACNTTQVPGQPHHHEQQQPIQAGKGLASDKKLQNEQGKGKGYVPEGKGSVEQLNVDHASGSSNDGKEIVLEQTMKPGPEQALVDQAVSHLRQIEPRIRNRKGRNRHGGMVGPHHNEIPRGLTGYAGYYLKQLFSMLLIHNPASLEEPIEGTRASSGREGLLSRHLKSAVEALETAADKGNHDAIYLLAQINFYGNWSHPRNYPTAFKRYKQLADLSSNATAQHMVGFMYATGFGGAVGRDQAKALLYHTFAALNGDIRSEMTIAFRHHSGIGAPRNCDKAAYHYKTVADKALKYFRDGPPGGKYIVRHNYRLADDEGGIYGEGASYVSSGINRNKRGTGGESAEDLDDILEYWDLMARKGNVYATYSLGKMYYEGGRNMPRNLQKARSYFLSIANKYWTSTGKVMNGVPQGLEKWAAKAAGQIGKMYLRGEGVPQDYGQAIKWFKRGVVNGDYYSQNGLGYMYLHGLGVPQDTLVAAKYFQTSADQDYAPAQVNLGKLFLEQNDVAIAIRYFELAARHGHVESYYYLAEIYNSGKGRERSCGMATAYYKIVAERVEAIHSNFEWANKAYAAGDIESALIGYIMGAEQGYESSQANVAYTLDTQKSRLPLMKALKPSPANTRNQELALIYWTRSAKQSNVDSLVKMGDYYLAGIGTEEDSEKAAACYQAASEFQQSAQALWNLGWMHENGIGVEQDFHLAKRFYDQALETNPVEAYLPVTLSLLKLRVRSFWNTITGGGINAIGSEDRPKKDWSFREFLKKWNEEVDAANAAAQAVEQARAAEEAGGAEGIPEDNTIPLDDAVYDDVVPDDELIESLVILALATAVIVLFYIRQQRQQQQRNNRNNRVQGAVVPGAQAAPLVQQPGVVVGEQQEQGQAQAEDREGLFPLPGAPEFGQWIIPH